MRLSAKNVTSVFEDCLFIDGEDMSTAIKAEGITATFGFHPERLKKHKEDVSDMIDDLPDEFKEGWSFLNACVTKDGDQWGEHNNIEQLLTLGLALGLARYCLPRSMWKALPGGMPYFSITKSPTVGELCEAVEKVKESEHV